MISGPMSATAFASSRSLDMTELATAPVHYPRPSRLAQRLRLDGVGEHLRLSHDVVVEHGHRLPLGGEAVRALRGEVGRPLLEPRRRLGVPDIDVGRQHRLAPRRDGGGSSFALRA